MGLMEMLDKKEKRFTVLVCGDRRWGDPVAIEDILKETKEFVARYGRTLHVITGDAAGADFFAQAMAERHSIPNTVFYADWDKYGKSAGPIRNDKMFLVGKPDMVYAFHDNIAESKGTKYVITKAIKEKIAVVLVDHELVPRCTTLTLCNACGRLLKKDGVEDKKCWNCGNTLIDEETLEDEDLECLGGTSD